MDPKHTGPRIRVGRASLEGGIARYARAFDLVEISGERGRHPRRPGLLAWRKAAGDEFVFSVVVPAALAALEAGAERTELLNHARMVADALGATWWLLRTPAAVAPSARSMRELKALVGELRTETRRVAWEPRGVWGDDGAPRAAEELGVHLVRDLAREDLLTDDDVVYTRLRALGEGARIGAAAAERVADRLEGASEAYVVVEGAGAGRVRQVLRDMLGAASEATEGDGLDEDDEELDEDEEDGGSGDEGEDDDGFREEEE
jgi:uncharacterized protein YecE (DUF72 family)